MPDSPNPGSDEAVAQGCICPVLDNYYGAGLPYPDGPVFWITAGCPVHAPDGGDIDPDGGDAEAA